MSKRHHHAPPTSNAAQRRAKTKPTLAPNHNPSERNSALGRLVDQHLRRLGMEVPRRFAFDATDTVMAMVAEEMGWSLLPPTALVKSRQHLNHMRVLPLPTSGFRRSIHVVTRKGELGSLPANIRKEGGAVIKQGYFTDVFAISPWLKPMIRR